MTKKALALGLAMGLLAGFAAQPVDAQSENDPPHVNIDLDMDEQQAEVHIRGEHFTTYQFGDDSRIPHLWPMHAEGGVTITRNYPLGEDEPVESTDHEHHHSFWTAFGDVNGHDHWHDLPIVTQNVEAESGDDSGWIRAENMWPDDEGDPIVDETREYRFYDTPAHGRIFDHTVTFTASYGDVSFGDYKEGMVAFRIRPEIQGDEAGVLTNFEGEQGEENIYGAPGPWIDYSGPIEGVGQRGIALFSHPSNFREPPWHVRDYGLAAANPFALSGVAGLDEDGTYVLEEGESLTFIFRAYIHSGDVEEADVAGQYEAFAEDEY
ncbi:MAG: PmoA family protein [Candidatus Hydrogenedentota bacterium]